MAEPAACLTPVWQAKPSETAAAAAQGASGFEDGGPQDQLALFWHHVEGSRQAAAACALCLLWQWVWASEAYVEERHSQICQGLLLWQRTLCCHLCRLGNCIRGRPACGAIC